MRTTSCKTFREITVNGLWPAPRLYCGVEGPDRKPPPEDQITMCSRWLELFATKTKTIRKKRSSYGLKHDVEFWTQKIQIYAPDDGRPLALGNYYYVCNGAFIEAARRAGYRIVPINEGSPNAYFNMKISKEMQKLKIVQPPREPWLDEPRRPILGL